MVRQLIKYVNFPYNQHSWQQIKERFYDISRFSSVPRMMACAYLISLFCREKLFLPFGNNLVQLHYKCYTFSVTTPTPASCHLSSMECLFKCNIVASVGLVRKYHKSHWMGEWTFLIWVTLAWHLCFLFVELTGVQIVNHCSSNALVLSERWML